MVQKEIVSVVERRSKGRRLLISIGRPVRRKGFVWFIEQVLPHLEDTIFIVIGPEPDYSLFSEAFLSVIPLRLRTQVQLFFGRSTEHHRMRELEQMYPKSFLWLKDVGHHTKNMLLSQAELFMMPNIPVDGDMEGFGLVALEANMCGTYVFAAELEGITSAVNTGFNGQLIKSQDSLEWVKQLCISSMNQPNTLQSTMKNSSKVF